MTQEIKLSLNRPDTKKRVWALISIGWAIGLALVAVTWCAGCGSSPIYPELGNYTPDASADVERTQHGASADSTCGACQNFPPIRCSCGSSIPSTGHGGCPPGWQPPNTYEITFVLPAGAGQASAPTGLYLTGGDCGTGNYVYSLVADSSQRTSPSAYGTMGYDSNHQIVFYANAPTANDAITMTYLLAPIDYQSPESHNPLTRVGLQRVYGSAAGGTNFAFVYSITNGYAFNAQYDWASVVGWGGINDYTQGSEGWLGSRNVTVSGYSVPELGGYVQDTEGNPQGIWVDVFAWAASNGHPCIAALQPTGTCPSFGVGPFVNAGAFFPGDPTGVQIQSGPSNFCGFHDYIGPEPSTGQGMSIQNVNGQMWLESSGAPSGTAWCLGI